MIYVEQTKLNVARPSFVSNTAYDLSEKRKLLIQMMT